MTPTFLYNVLAKKPLPKRKDYNSTADEVFSATPKITRAEIKPFSREDMMNAPKDNFDGSFESIVRNIKDLNSMIDQQYCEETAQRLELDTTQAKKALALVFENLQMLDGKQKDYGPKNIAPFDENDLNLFMVCGRANDKMQRLLKLTKDKIKDEDAEPVNESIEDTLRDLCNYAIIALLVLKNQWED